MFKVKAAIITLNGRITLGQHNIRSIDIASLKTFVANRMNYNEVDFVSTTKKRLKSDDPEAVSYYKDASNTSLLLYDDIYVYNSTANFIGGAIQPHTVKQLKEISTHKGRLFYIQTDPQLHLVNLATIIFDALQKGRKLTFANDLRLTLDDVEKMKQTSWTVLYNGKNTDNYQNFYLKKIASNHRCIISSFEYVDYFEKLYATIPMELSNDKPLDIREYDLVYYGNWRPERAKAFKKYFENNGLKNYLIGIKPSHLDKVIIHEVAFNDYTDHSLLGNEINRAIASIVIGDPTHGDTEVKTARFFENIKCKVVSFIDVQYDPKRVLYQNELLKSHLYVKDGKELAQKLHKIKVRKGLFERIIDLQLNELQYYYK